MDKVVFLDRDGTINVDTGEPVFLREHWEWTPNAIDALRTLQDSGYKLAVVTNQTGIGVNLYTEEQMQELHNWMDEELQKNGVKLAGIEYCPHVPNSGCGCEKPDTGMFDRLKLVLGEVGVKNSWTIGDKEKDLLFGKNVGTKTALIRSKYWNESELSLKPDVIVDSLYEAAHHITND